MEVSPAENLFSVASKSMAVAGSYDYYFKLFSGPNDKLLL